MIAGVPGAGTAKSFRPADCTLILVALAAGPGNRR
jgi:hypothetical protein